ncbi:TetR/AcrR family transcriptional regulator [Conexibacter sp. SYSU D00693]|uniref:TetR/AcrR family transcriptional regulator n=1 Tax=Conexibacter sp. SYSU D00693 TaxID=2812560 RepID=UPI00196B371F|nr:TetR/AcrR family transcriptional regulator [Conexibacter sp. SYSU D00693]
MSDGHQRASARAYGGVSAAERVAQRRERLLDAALELYGTHGFLTTGVKDVCREAGVTDRYFYESFRDSAELFTAAFDRETAELLRIVAEAVGQADADPESQVRAAIGSFVRAMADDPRRARLVFVEAPTAGGDAERHVQATLRRFTQLVAATARPHVADQVPDRLVELGAVAVVGAIDRVLAEWQDGTVHASLDEVVEFLVALFHAVGATAGVDRRR